MGAGEGAECLGHRGRAGNLSSKLDIGTGNCEMAGLGAAPSHVGCSGAVFGSLAPGVL